MHGLVALFLGVIALAIISCCRTWSFLSPCRHVEGNPGVGHPDDDSQIGDCCDHVGHFDDSRGSYDCDADGSFIHGYVRWEDEPFSFPSAASYPWQSYQECQPSCWLLDTAQRRQSF